MAEQKSGSAEIIMKAYQISNGEFVDMVVEHGELPGITLDHLRFWSTYMNTPEGYKMWHPEDHVSHSVETTTDKDGETVTYMYAEEKVGDYPASVMRMRKEPVDSAPVQQVYKPLSTNTILGPNDEVFGGVYHEIQPTENGMIMRSTFRLPARVPQDFLDAMHKHSLIEMGNFPKFLPQLYQRETGHK